MKKIVDLIKERPEIRTGIFILSVILSGILSSAFVTEITIDGRLVWNLFYKTTSFWLICIYCSLLYIYNKFLYQYEKSILKFLDDDYCKAYIVNQCLPEIIEKYKKDLREYKNTTELIDIRVELKKLTKKMKVLATKEFNNKLKYYDKSFQEDLLKFVDYISSTTTNNLYKIKKLSDLEVANISVHKIGEYRIFFVSDEIKNPDTILLIDLLKKDEQFSYNDFEGLDYELPNINSEQETDLVLLKKALKKLALIDGLKGRIVELRYFGGQTIEETAEILGLSSLTVMRDWNIAKAWLAREIKAKEKPEDKIK